MKTNRSNRMRPAVAAVFLIVAIASSALAGPVPAQASTESLELAAPMSIDLPVAPEHDAIEFSEILTGSYESAEVLLGPEPELNGRISRTLTRPHFRITARFTPTPGALIASGTVAHDKFTRIGMISVTTRAPKGDWSFPKICNVDGSGFAHCAVKVRDIPGTVVSVSYRRLGVWSFPLQLTRQ